MRASTLLLPLLFACGAEPAPAPAPAPPVVAPPVTPPATAGESVQRAAREAVANAAGVAADAVTVLSSEAAEWPDSCLGLADADTLCAQMLTPGWRVVLEAGGRRWTARTDADGRVVKVEPAAG